MRKNQLTMLKDTKRFCIYTDYYYFCRKKQVCVKIFQSSEEGSDK